MINAIAGYINSIEKISNTLLEKMAQTIKHSPNINMDTWQDQVLAISQASYKTAKSFNAPIFNANNTLKLVMVGEIFDYEKQKLELIQRGYKFKFPDSAAEFCLHLYEEKGNAAFCQLNGSFGLAIYNTKTSEFLLVSDRFSSQPIFYHLTNKKTLLFGSQVASILKSNEVSRELDREAVFEYFTFLQVFGTKTFCKNIKMLEPATILTYINGKISFSQYWSFKYQEKCGSEQYYVERLAKTIKTAVQRRTQGNDRLGLLLSGGLDSRIILAAADKEMVCFTVGDFENREVKTAKKICQAKGCKHIFLKRDVDHYVNLWEKAVDIGDSLYCFTHAYAIGFFEQITRECDVVFHGYALERFFRGTMLAQKKFSLFGTTIFNWLDNLKGSCLARQILSKFKTSFYALDPAQLFSQKNYDVFDKILLESIKKITDESENNCDHKQDQFLWANTRYPQGFAFLNVSSIRAFMNERSIIFDNDLIDLHLEMPLKYRANSRIWKKVIAQLNSKIASVPNSNQGLKIWQKAVNKLFFRKPEKLPAPIFTQGSWPNFLLFIRYHKKMRDLIEKIIKDQENISPDIFNLQKIDQVYKEYMNGKNEYSILLYLLLTFGTWYKKHGLKIFSNNLKQDGSKVNEE
ncbi:MAG: asparagine synthase-related protein [Candidatus Omnitrophota bacterium]